MRIGHYYMYCTLVGIDVNEKIPVWGRVAPIRTAVGASSSSSSSSCSPPPQPMRLMLTASTRANKMKNILFLSISSPFFKIFSVVLDFDDLRRYSPPFGAKAAGSWFRHLASLVPPILGVIRATTSVPTAITVGQRETEQLTGNCDGMMTRNSGLVAGKLHALATP